MQISEQIQEIHFPNKPSVYLKKAMHKYKQVRGTSSDLKDGRCALGAIISEQGWDGQSEWCSNSSRLEYSSVYSKIIDMNDYLNATFSDIAIALEALGQ